MLEDEIDIIIRNQDKSLQRIERVLDTLLSCLYMGIGEVQFNRLNSYYATFNKKNAGKYAKFYHEIIDR